MTATDRSTMVEAPAGRAAPEPATTTTPEPTARIPRATYRLQLNGAFTFRDATAIVPYLADLGISDVYTSPYFAANPGSSHGYDVADYSRINPEIGTEADYQAFVASLRRHGLGHVFDLVPNHMGIGHGSNQWWLDVLENGQASPYADWFDIDWRPLKPELRHKVLLPILGDRYGAVLERGELALRLADGVLTVWYYESPLPIAPPTYPLVLRPALERLVATLPADDGALLEFHSILTALERLPGNDERDPAAIAERQREQVVAKRRLSELLSAAPAIASEVEAAIVTINGETGDPASFDALDALLDAQAYRLASWRVAGEEINYRRFFAINELAAIRQELPEVFAATHALLLRLIASGAITGLRIDHPDGLWDPAGYVDQLQRAARRTLTGDDEPDGAGPIDRERLPLYLVIEKILEHGEVLPADWPVHGTVGYDFATAATGLFVDAANRRLFDTLYRRFTGETLPLGELVYQTKHLVMRQALVSEVNVLARALNRISEQDRRLRDFTLNNLRDALREVIACFPVYRTYLDCADGTVAERDRRYIDAAVAAAKKRNPAADDSVFDFLADVLLQRPGSDHAELTERQRDERCRFTMKFQQLTGPVMAKGLEDTAFYRYNRLLSLNEVGSDPAQFGIDVAQFHRQNSERLRRWPRAMLASATHDTKRGEDVRARIDVLSEIPRDWRAALNRWARLNRKHKTRVEGAAAPDRNDEYAFYQTLLGAWPDRTEEPGPDWVERIQATMLKSIREAARQTSWQAPNDAYEAALRTFIAAILDPRRGAAFLTDFSTLQRRVAHIGAFNALAMQLLKLTSPGVPDIYQGTELWDRSLVDPDNRRPVDYTQRAALLRALRRRRPSVGLAGELLASKDDGRIKLWVTARALSARQRDPDLFGLGEYLPLEVRGPRRDQVCAFARRLVDEHGAREIIVVVPRLVASLAAADEAPHGAAVWGDTSLGLPDSAAGIAYRNLFTNQRVTAVAGDDGAALPLAEVFTAFPVALLERVSDGPAANATTDANA